MSVVIAFTWEFFYYIAHPGKWKRGTGSRSLGKYGYQVSWLQTIHDAAKKGKIIQV
jgi:hypothetical protein